MRKFSFLQQGLAFILNERLIKHEREPVSGPCLVFMLG